MVALIASPALPGPREIAAGASWRLHEFVCDAGPGDREFEERHDRPTIAFIASGRFRYRGSTGRALLAPGQLLLGNAGACYACGHDHDRGDRCLSLTLAHDLFDEIAAASTGAGFHFPAAALPAPAAAIAAFVRADLGTVEDWDAWVANVAGATVAALTGPPEPVHLTATLERRIGRALALIDADPTAPFDTDRLAAAAGLSRYHFLRAFRAVTGLTPHRYLLARRLALAARRLLQGDGDVLSVALDSGFTDPSGFQRHFRAAFGTTPARFRGGGAALKRR